MRYLFIGAHVDDLELCCGATISRMVDYGHTVHVLCLSHQYNGISLMTEWINSMKILKPETCSIKDFETRKFNYNRQEVLDLLTQYKDFDYVFTHSAQDQHQDHKTVGEESIRAFKHTNLVTYTGEWNQRTQTKNYFIELHKSNVERKVEALKCYFSQAGKPYMHPDYIWANVLNNGVICGAKYAEAFEVINFIE